MGTLHKDQYAFLISLSFLPRMRHFSEKKL